MKLPLAVFYVGFAASTIASTVFQGSRHRQHLLTGTVVGAAGTPTSISMNPGPFSKYAEGPFTPFEDLAALSASQYTVLQHPSFPAYSVRIKKSHFCDGGVQAYTGYIDVEARHLFFYFFESRRDPQADDVVFWTNGGPGGSSSLGLFMELGPCRVSGPNTTERFDQSWNNHANIFFIDQPVGVGFSYADYGEKVSSTLDAAEDIAAFVAIFFEHFSQFKGRPFHMAGESYAGRYLPAFAAAIYDRNTQLRERGIAPINLTSVMIGNGVPNFITMLLSYYDVQCGGYGFPHITSISECVRLKQLHVRYEKRLRASCEDLFDRIECADVWALSWTAFADKLFEERNPYDATRPCTDYPGDSEACYPIMKFTRDYLNNNATQKLLGVDRQHPNFTMVDLELSARFSTLDYYSFRADHFLAALLERGIRVLVYAGTNDWAGNWVGSERITLDLEWSKQTAYRGAPMREWVVDGEVAGKVRSGGGLTFATINGAGHLAPFDQPVRSLEMANRWLAGQDL